MKQPDKRLCAAADLVRQGAVFADIGTDHGKLPIYLAKVGKIKRAVASDINEMPLAKAVSNIKKYGFEDVIDTYLTDGLKGIEKFSPDCVVIAGMGGELIEQILSNSTLDKNNVKFILQPMTKEESLQNQLQMCHDFGIMVRPEDLLAPKTFHAKTAAALIQRDYPAFATETVVLAVRWHTTGHADM